MDDIQELYCLFPEIKDHINVTKKVGQGTFSYVYLGHFIQNENEKVALKYVIPTSSPTRTKQEIECLLNIGGKENVIGVLSVLRNKSHILILMPFIENESFHDYFIYWDIIEVRDYIKNLIIALNRVHECGIIHRDVKPSNFLYDSKNKKYALVDFGLAQAYDKSSENIFNYEKLNKNRLNTQNENSSAKLIAINTKKPSNNSHLVSTTPKATKSNSNKADNNSLPHAPTKEKNETNNSQNTDQNLNNQINSLTSPTATNSIANVNSLNSPRPKINTPNLQKYYSFQKPSFSISDNKCSCFNMPFVCEICTTRANKWAPRAGTAGFRAPEVLFRSNYQTPAVDIWSVGVILLSILSGRYPFFKAVDDNMAIMQLTSLFGAESMRKSSLKYGESFVCSYDKKPEDLKEICKTLRKNTIKGLSISKNKNINENKIEKENIKKVVEEFPDSAYDLLKKLLELDGDKRLSAQEALKHEFLI